MKHISLKLLISLTCLLFGSISHAQITINLTQANQNGFDLDNLQTTLQSITEMEVKLDSNNTDIFNKEFDLVSLNSAQADVACSNQQIVRLKDIDEFKPLFQRRNFLQKNNNNCGVNFATYSMVIAYPIFNMVTTRPESAADLFDIERFPGMRALPDSPIGTLEWALLSYGIPINEVYQLLSTERGIKLAFAKLDTIKRHIHWWKDISELMDLIKNSQVSLAAGPHNVFYDLQFNHPMEILWNGQLVVEMNLGINNNSTNTDQAQQLLLKLMSDSAQFKLAYEYAFGPTNRQTLKTLSLLPQAGQVLVFVPTYKKNMQNAIWLDYNWHETLQDIINERFLEWRSQSK